MIVALLSAIAVFGADNTLGTWKLNVEKSTYTPAPFPFKSLTVVRTAADGGVNSTITGEATNGNAINSSYTGKYDGTPSSLTGTGMAYDTVAIKQVNANTLTDERKKTGGSYHTTGRLVISNGGKTMTLTLKGTGTDGKPTTATTVYDKQ